MPTRYEREDSTAGERMIVARRRLFHADLLPDTIPYRED